MPARRADRLLSHLPGEEDGDPSILACDASTFGPKDSLRRELGSHNGRGTHPTALGGKVHSAAGAWPRRTARGQLGRPRATFTGTKVR